MNNIKWIKTWFSILLLIPIIALCNFLIDPYGIYNSKYLNLNKSEQINYVRLLKAVKIRELVPKSIILGTSRAEGAYDPSHEYFQQPSYNAATSGSSMYENLKYLELAIQSGNLKQVLLVADYRMFNGTNKKKTSDFNTYFASNFNKYTYLFSIDTLTSSIKTVQKQNKEFDIYLENGVKTPLYPKRIKEYNVLEAFENIEKNYYKGYTSSYKYMDSKTNPFDDFKTFLKLCYENDIKLEIIFGPSHIRLWESLDYYLGFDYWLEWKKDIVKSVKKISKVYNKEPYNIMDFSVYHELTAEKVPRGLGTMKYHGESSHYKKELGLIVLNSLVDKSEYPDFGKNLNIKNINNHVEMQIKQRHKYFKLK